MDPQLTSLIVPPDEVAHIDECLARLVDDTGGNYALLLDKSGQVIASNGDGNRQDTTALGALIAGSFASSQQIAKLLREKDFRMLLQQGVRENLFIALIENAMIINAVGVFWQGLVVGLVLLLAVSLDRFKSIGRA